MRSCCFIPDDQQPVVKAHVAEHGLESDVDLPGIGCGKEAEWQLWHGPSPDDYTESCTEHVGELLVVDVPEIRVYRIEAGAANAVG